MQWEAFAAVVPVGLSIMGCPFAHPKLSDIFKICNNQNVSKQEKTQMVTSHSNADDLGPCGFNHNAMRRGNHAMCCWQMQMDAMASTLEARRLEAAAWPQMCLNIGGMLPIYGQLNRGKW